MKHLILVDRSGSMQTRWREVMGSIDEYINTVSEDDTIEVRAFSSNGFGGDPSFNYDLVGEGVGKNTVLNEGLMPMGGTPLFDAMGAAYKELESVDRGVLIVLTDGHENTSTVHDRNTIRRARDIAESNDIETIFIGANFEDFGDAHATGMDMTKTITINDGNYRSSMADIATRTMMYSQAQTAEEVDAAKATMSFNDEDRAKFKGGA